MKILLLARPDHSINLYHRLSQKPEVDVKFHTFGVFKQNSSLLRKWKPYVKTVDSQADISYQFTAFHRLLYFLQKHISFDYYKTENQISEYFFNKFIQKSLHDLDILHYWPVYCHKAVEAFKKSKPKVKLLADVYAAHPIYTQKLLEPEFEKFSISFSKSHFYRSKEREIASLENTENIVVPSEYMAQMYRQYLPEVTIFTASYGILNYSKETSSNEVIRQSTQVVKMVFVGKISIEKGCFYLLEAMKELPTTEFSLDVIGDIEAFQVAIFKKYSHLSHVRFLGKLPNSQVLSLIPRYHVFIMPSLTDAYSLATAEALSSNIPVIVTENVGIKDDVRKFKIGEVCKTQDIDSLLQAILKFMDEPYRQFLKSNIENFIDEYKKNDYASKVLNIYQTLAHNN